MKLGIINGWEEGNIKYVSDKGLEAVEFCVNHNYNSAEFLAKAPDIKGYCKKYNVIVGSMGRWGMKRIDDNGEIIDVEIVPKTITKEVRDIIDLSIKDDKTKGKKKMSKSDAEKTIALMTEQMQKAAKNLDFELAAALRDKIFELRANQK